MSEMTRFKLLSGRVTLTHFSSPFHPQELLRKSYARESNEPCAEPLCSIISLCICQLYHNIENLAPGEREGIKPTLAAPVATMGACSRGCGMLDLH